MDITLELIKYKDIDEIFHFEIDNSAFFERSLPPRPLEYHDIISFEKLMKTILDEQSKNQCFMHIIRNNSKKMVGRINFHSLSGENLKSAELGYRIGEKYQGQGYATEAVKTAVKAGFDQYGFNRIEAGTSTKNIGSQKVLEKNGFKFIGRENRVIKVNGQWLDGLLYELLQ